MANDVHYIIIFSSFFLLLGLLAPLLNAEFDSDLSGNDYELPDSEDSSLTFWKILGNIFLLPFWTFGLPAWVNVWVLSIIRIPFIFVIARNIWVGGGS